MALPTDTTQNDVITALADALIALQATTLDGVSVTSAPMDLALMTGDHVEILDIPESEENWEGLGNYKRTEDYEIRMACYSYEPGAEESAMRACRDRAYAIHRIVAGYIRSNPHMGGVTIKQMSGTSYTPGYDDRARWTRLGWSIRVTAQIEVV